MYGVTVLGLAEGSQWVSGHGSFSNEAFKTQRTVTLQMSYIFAPVSEPGGEARFPNSRGSGAQGYRPVHETPSHWMEISVP